MTNLLTAGALCTRIVSVTYRDASLAYAARMMREGHVGCLVVVNREEHCETVVGILTDRDIVVSAVALVSFDDLLAAVAIQMQGLTEALIAERQHEGAARH